MKPFHPLHLSLILLVPLFLLGLTYAGQEVVLLEENPPSMAVVLTHPDLQSVSQSITNADTWLKTHVLDHYPSKPITTILIAPNPNLCDLIPTSTKNLLHSLTRWGLLHDITISVSPSQTCPTSTQTQKQRPAERKLSPLFPSNPISLPPEAFDAGAPTTAPPPCMAAPAQAPAAEEGGRGLWCVAKPTVTEEALQTAMDYACGEGGADCGDIGPKGRCFYPDTVVAHASFAFNSYWQRTKRVGGSCSFGGTAVLISDDPSFQSCQFMLT